MNAQFLKKLTLFILTLSILSDLKSGTPNLLDKASQGDIADLFLKPKKGLKPEMVDFLTKMLVDNAKILYEALTQMNKERAKKFNIDSPFVKGLSKFMNSDLSSLIKEFQSKHQKDPIVKAWTWNQKAEFIKPYMDSAFVKASEEFCNNKDNYSWRLCLLILLKDFLTKEFFYKN